MAKQAIWFFHDWHHLLRNDFYVIVHSGYTSILEKSEHYISGMFCAASNRCIPRCEVGVKDVTIGVLNKTTI
ncbi:hypothetical protein H5410_011715 [Solanum commersonii]|uniref:Uncharacterized protein n=1 Tax=Solanum commersonii TaxID=4109 RepID=A0A9J6AQ99_SOLCO|nr:hypothetical protein H5410_011715 [Solanum commersonii]